MYFGIALIIIGVIWYVFHTLIYNYYLRKNAPEILQPERPQSRTKEKRKQVTIAIMAGTIPAWVAVLGIPPIPLVLLGVLTIIISGVINLFW